MNISTVSHVQESEIFVNATDAQNHKLSPEQYWVFLALDATSIMANCYFHRLTYLMIQREKLEKGCVLMRYLLLPYAVITPIAFFLLITYAVVLLNADSLPSHFLGNYFCHAYGILAHFAAIYIASFSLLAAVLRYWFIVNSISAKRFGEERLAKIFMMFHLIVPIIVSILNAVSKGEKDLLVWVNYCWGNIRETQNTESNEYQKVNHFFCGNNENVVATRFGIDSSHFIISVLRTMCSGIKSLYLVFLSNILELFIYILIFRYLNR